jgi:phosphoglycolate phosphatase-like HAD superfamily hydrolase
VSQSRRPAVADIIGARRACSDIAAGRDAGIATIAYANKPGKHQRLVHAGAQFVIDDLRAIALAGHLSSSDTRPTRR